MIDSDGFRPNVGIILSNPQGQLLWARRIGLDAWQFPQGGIRTDETPAEAMYRELAEEVGLLRHEESAREFMSAVRELSTQSPPRIGTENSMDMRMTGTGSQILRALGVRRMRVLSAPRTMHALSGFGLEVVEYLMQEQSRQTDE